MTNEAKEKLTVEEVKKDLKKMFGLLIIKASKNKFVLVSVLKENGELSNVGPPNPEILRIYPLLNKNIEEEEVYAPPLDGAPFELCLIDEIDHVYSTLARFSRAYDKIKVVFTNDNCETIEEFFVDNIKEPTLSEMPTFTTHPTT